MCWNNTGGTVADETYFWGLVLGLGYGSADDANIAIGDDLAVETTSGQMEDYADGVRCGFSLEAPSANATFSMVCVGNLAAVPTA